MLSRLIAAGIAATVVAACASMPPPHPPEPSRPTVAARWVADDGSVVAVNLVVPIGTDPNTASDLAERERSQHPGARVIVRIFPATAGLERYVIGHVPAAGEPLVETPAANEPLVETPASSQIGLFDFPP